MDRNEKIKKSIRKEIELTNEKILKGDIKINKRSDLEFHAKQTVEMGYFKATFFEGVGRFLNSKFAAFIGICFLVFYQIPNWIKDIQSGAAAERWNNIVHDVTTYNYKKWFCKHKDIDISKAEITFPEKMQYDGQAVMVVPCERCGKEMTYSVGPARSIIQEGNCSQETIYKVVYDFNNSSEWKWDYSELCFEFSYSTIGTHDFRILTVGYEATCNSEGLSDSEICKECGYIKEAVALPKLEHGPTDVDYIEPTCHTFGYSKGGSVCLNCHHVYEGKGDQIPMISHEYDVKTVEATYNLSGKSIYNCKYCDDAYEVEIKPGFASVANYEVISKDDGSQFVLIKKAISTQETLEIPSHIDGIPVEIIDNYAFQDCKNIKTVILPDSIKELRRNAFGNCSLLTTINLPEGLTYIGESAFLGCSSLTSIELPNNLKFLGNSAFEGCKSLSGKIIIPETIETILDSTFKDCSSLQSVEVKFKFARIKNSAFRNCTSLVSVDFPSSLAEIGEAAFANCKSLAGELVIPGSINALGGSAFEDCISLKSVVLEDGVQQIYSAAFEGCSSLISVKLAPSISFVGTNAFKDCNNILEVYDTKNLVDWSYKVLVNHKSMNEASWLFNDDIGSLYFHDKTKSTYYLVSLKNTGTDITIEEKINGNKYHMLDGALSSLYDVESLTMYNVSGYSLSSLFGGNVPNTLTSLKVDVKGSVSKEYFANISSLKTIELTNNVTGAASAFYNCNSVSELTLPGSMKVGYLFFNYDSLIKTNGEQYFRQYTPSSLKKVNATGTNIVDYFCYDLNSIEEITLSKDINYVSNSAFEKCSGLNKVYYDGTLENWCNITFNGEFATPMNEAEMFYMLGDDNNYSLLVDVNIPSSITSIKSYTFYGFNTIKSVSFSESVTSIGYNSFANSSVQSIGFSNSLLTVGESSFSNCFGLKEVILPDSVTEIKAKAFEDCKSLESIQLGKSLNKIGEKAFYNCFAMKKIVIPKNVYSIGKDAFYGCSSMTEVYNLSSLNIEAKSTNNGYVGYYTNTIFTSLNTTKYEYDNFIYLDDGMGNYEIISYKGNHKTIIFPSGIDGKEYSIAKNSFINDTSIEKIVIPSYVISIGESAFEGCINLKTIEFEEGISSIERCAFYNCSGLSKLILPESILEIGASAFCNCTNLQEIYIPAGVNKVGEASFRKTYEKLEKITMPTTVNIEKTFANFMAMDYQPITVGFKEIYIIGSNEIPEGYFAYCLAVEKIVIDESTTKINNNAIRYRSKLIELYLPSTITEIGYGNFAGLSSIRKIEFESDRYKFIDNYKGFVDLTTNTLLFATADLVIPDYIDTIGSYAYDELKATEITIPDNIKVIKSYAFNYSKLTKVVLPNNIERVENYAFNRSSNLKSIIIPTSIKYFGSFLTGYSCDYYYLGTQEQWNKITFSSTTYGYYIYSETPPTVSYKYWHYDENNNPVIWVI